MATDSVTDTTRTYNTDISKRNYEQRDGEVNIGQTENMIRSIYDTGRVVNVNDDHVGYNSGVCSAGIDVTVANILNLYSIRGGCKMSCGCGMKGGCFTCKDGVKNITHIYKTVHIIIPELYGKYNSDLNIKKKSKKVKKVKKGKKG